MKGSFPKIAHSWLCSLRGNSLISLYCSWDTSVIMALPVGPGANTSMRRMYLHAVWGRFQKARVIMVDISDPSSASGIAPPDRNECMVKCVCSSLSHTWGRDWKGPPNGFSIRLALGYNAEKVSQTYYLTPELIRWRNPRRPSRDMCLYGLPRRRLKSDDPSPHRIVLPHWKLNKRPLWLVNLRIRWMACGLVDCRAWWCWTPRCKRLRRALKPPFRTDRAKCKGGGASDRRWPLSGYEVTRVFLDCYSCLLLFFSGEIDILRNKGASPWVADTQRIAPANHDAKVRLVYHGGFGHVTSQNRVVGVG